MKKKKADEEAKWKRQKNLNQCQNNAATPNVGIMNISPWECTHLMIILGNDTFSSQVLNLDDVVVSIGEYL